jgi:hypothetical protein
VSPAATRNHTSSRHHDDLLLVFRLRIAFTTD